MNLNITVAGLASFEEDKPMGLMTFGDRKELEKRRTEASSSVPQSVSTDFEPSILALPVPGKTDLT